jgi:hypothetical protein
MSYINPLTGGIMAAGQVQAHAAADQSKEVRRAQAAKRGSSRASDTFEHHVESTEAAAPVGDESKKQPPKQQTRRGKPQKDDPPQLDVRA